MNATTQMLRILRVIERAGKDGMRAHQVERSADVALCYKSVLTYLHQLTADGMISEVPIPPKYPQGGKAYVRYVLSAAGRERLREVA